MATKRSGTGCLILFGLVFIVMGSIPGCIALHDVQAARATATWTETTAEILELDLRQGDDTRSVVCRYRWRAPARDAVEGGGDLAVYEGSQVGIHGGSDNIGDWQEATYARLDAAQRAERPIPCWYDPADPTQAVLDRTVRWEMVGFMAIFPLVFGVAGGGIIAVGLAQRRRTRRRQEELAAADGAVVWGRTGGGMGVIVIAVFWNAISWAAVAALWFSVKVFDPAMLVVGLFPLIGVLFAWSAALVVARRLRHGRVGLRLASGTWTAGGRVQADLLIHTQPQPGDALLFTLTHQRRLHGKDNSTSWHTEWSHQFTADPAAARPDPVGTAVPITLPLPADLAPVDDDHAWRLSYQLVRPGLDDITEIDLPVRAGPAADPGLTAAAVSADADRAAPLAVLQRAGIAVSAEGHAVAIALPAWRNPGLHIAGLVCAMVFSVAGAAFWHYVGWWTALLSVPLIAAIWRGALRSCIWRSAIRLDGGRVTVSAGWLATRSDDLAWTEIARVDSGTSMSTGDTPWHNLHLVLGDGRRIAIARGVPGPAAKRLVELIEAARSAG